MKVATKRRYADRVTFYLNIIQLADRPAPLKGSRATEFSLINSILFDILVSFLALIPLSENNPMVDRCNLHLRVKASSISSLFTFFSHLGNQGHRNRARNIQKFFIKLQPEMSLNQRFPNFFGHETLSVLGNIHRTIIVTVNEPYIFVKLTLHVSIL